MNKKPKIKVVSDNGIIRVIKYKHWLMNVPIGFIRSEFEDGSPSTNDTIKTLLRESKDELKPIDTRMYYKASATYMRCLLHRSGKELNKVYPRKNANKLLTNEK